MYAFILLGLFLLSALAQGTVPLTLCAIKRLLEVVCSDADFCVLESLCVVLLGQLDWVEKCLGHL